MRHGVRPNGEHLYPVFPYTAFTKLTNEDMAALFAYLRSLPAVRQSPPANESRGGRNGNGELSTTGYSVQMLLDTDGNILVVPPGFYEAFCRKWEAGELE